MNGRVCTFNRHPIGPTGVPLIPRPLKDPLANVYLRQNLTVCRLDPRFWNYTPVHWQTYFVLDTGLILTL